MRYLSAGAALLLLACLHLTPTQVHADQLNLQDLANGGMLMDGLTTYSNFQVNDVGSVTPDLAVIDVSTIGTGGLQFDGPTAFALPGGVDSIGLQVSYDVSTTGPGFRAAGVDLTGGNPNAGNTGVVDVFNEVFDGISFVSDSNAFLDPLFGASQLVDSGDFGGTLVQFNANTSISLFGDPNAPVSVNSFRVNFSAVPEPGSSLVLLIGSSLALLRRRTR